MNRELIETEQNSNAYNLENNIFEILQIQILLCYKG